MNILFLDNFNKLEKTSALMFLVFPPASKLCGSEEFWEQAVRQRCNTVSAEVASLALEFGWHSIFFTSKLQVQKMISRRKQKTEGQQEEQACCSETKSEESPVENLGTSGCEEESHPGIISELSLGTDTSMDS